MVDARFFPHDRFRRKHLLSCQYFPIHCNSEAPKLSPIQKNKRNEQQFVWSCLYPCANRSHAMYGPFLPFNSFPTQYSSNFLFMLSQVSSISPWVPCGVSITFCLVLRYHWIVSLHHNTLILWPFRDGLKLLVPSYVPLLALIFSAWLWNDRKNVWILLLHCIFYIPLSACSIRYETVFMSTTATCGSDNISMYNFSLSLSCRSFILSWPHHIVLSCSVLGRVSVRMGMVVDPCGRFGSYGHSRWTVMRKERTGRYTTVHCQ